MPASSPPLPGCPPPRTRRRLLVLGGLFFALQLYLPARYYLSEVRDDERFTWRMFSVIRMTSCRARLFEARATPGGQRWRESELAPLVHRAWVHALERNRPQVVEAFLERRCQNEGMRQVRLVNLCRDHRGQTQQPRFYTRDCHQGSFEER